MFPKRDGDQNRNDRDDDPLFALRQFENISHPASARAMA